MLVCPNPTRGASDRIGVHARAAGRSHLPRCDAAECALALLPFGGSPDRATVATQLSGCDPATAETLRAATASDTQTAALPADSVWLGPLILRGAL